MNANLKLRSPLEQPDLLSGDEEHIWYWKIFLQPFGCTRNVQGNNSCISSQVIFSPPVSFFPFFHFCGSFPSRQPGLGWQELSWGMTGSKEDAA